jgi:starch phosphorylase
MFDGDNGWAIPSAEEETDLARRDQIEAAALFDLLEGEIIPLFYERDGDGLPRRWLERVRTSLASLGPRVTADRMVREYVERFYEPAAEELSGR